MKKIIFVIRKIVIAIAMLYSIDLITNSKGIIVPLNPLTIIISTLLGLPGIIGLFIIKIFIL